MSRPVLADERLAAAIEEGSMQTVRQLIESGDFGIDRPLAHLMHRPTPLMHAIDETRDEIVYLLLELGADVRGVDLRGRTACHLAAWHNAVHLLDALRERGADLNQRDKDDKSPLDVALAESCYDTSRFVTRMIELGARVPLDRNGQCKLAALNSICIQSLIDARVAVSKLRDDEGQTPLHLKTLDGDDDFVAMRMLVDVCGVDLDARDEFGDTCCHVAAAADEVATLRWLINAGADADVVDNHSFTPLHSAASPAVTHDGLCLPLLLAAGADVHALCADNVTALQYLAFADEPLVNAVHSMLAMGVDLDAKMSDNMLTARELLTLRNFVIDPAAIQVARRRILRLRLDLVRERAFQICVGLQSLRLDALQLCEILQHAWRRVGPLVAFHQWWAIATTVKHFHRKPKTKTKIRKVKI